MTPTDKPQHEHQHESQDPQAKEQSGQQQQQQPPLPPGVTLDAKTGQQTVTLSKGFDHEGHTYKKGDKFSGDPEQIQDLIRQDYVEVPDDKAKSGKGGKQSKEEDQPQASHQSTPGGGVQPPLKGSTPPPKK